MDEIFTYTTYEGASQAYTEAQANAATEKASLYSALASLVFILAILALVTGTAVAVAAWRWAV